MNHLITNNSNFINNYSGISTTTLNNELTVNLCLEGKVKKCS